MFPLFIACAAAVLTALPASLPQSRMVQKDMTAQDYIKAFNAAPRDKQGRITLSCFVEHAYREEEVRQDVKGYLGLAPLQPQVTMEDALKKPQLRDCLQVRLAPNVVAGLKRLGIDDLAAHFQGRTVRVTGTPESATYFCFPAVVVYTVTVQRLQDLEVLSK